MSTWNCCLTQRHIHNNNSVFDSIFIISFFIVRRELNFPNFQFHILIKIIFCKKFNVYFALGKDRSLRVCPFCSLGLKVESAVKKHYYDLSSKAVSITDVSFNWVCQSQVYNRNFEETERACTDDSNLVSHLLFNPVLNELITGGDVVRVQHNTTAYSVHVILSL